MRFLSFGRRRAKTDRSSKFLGGRKTASSGPTVFGIKFFKIKKFNSLNSGVRGGSPDRFVLPISSILSFHESRAMSGLVHESSFCSIICFWAFPTLAMIWLLMHILKIPYTIPLQCASKFDAGKFHLKNVINSISGLVAEYIVAIDVTRARFPADAFCHCPYHEDSLCVCLRLFVCFYNTVCVSITLCVSITHFVCF